MPLKMNKPVAKEDMEMLTDPAFRIGEPFPFLSGPFLFGPLRSSPFRCAPFPSAPIPLRHLSPRI